jgi:hypothetical protein
MGRESHRRFRKADEKGSFYKVNNNQMVHADLGHNRGTDRGDSQAANRRQSTREPRNAFVFILIQTSESSHFECGSKIVIFPSFLIRQANRPIHFQGLRFGVRLTNSPAFGTVPNTLFSMKMWNCRLLASQTDDAHTVVVGI